MIDRRAPRQSQRHERPTSLFARFIGRLRLRHKLAFMLSVAALLPVLGTSTVAMRLVLVGLRSGARAQTERTMRYALNQVLSQVKDVFLLTDRLAETPELADLLHLDPAATAELLSRNEEDLPPSLLEIIDKNGIVVGRRVIGGVDAKALRVPVNSPALLRAFNYERRVDIDDSGAGLIMRASSPVIDDSFQIRGVLVLSVPLDTGFAERLRSHLQADVVVYKGAEPSASSFVAADGRREPGFTLPESLSSSVLAGGTRVVDLGEAGRMYSVGLAPLQNLEGERLGILAVALDEDALADARHQAWRYLLLGGASAVTVALVLASFLSRRLTLPLGHLHAGALAVARGDLEHRIIQETGDEIGDLAVAFAQMTSAVKENQERLAARMREMTTLHDIGRAVSSVLDPNEVLHKVVEEVAEVLDAQRCVLLLAAGEDVNVSWHIGASVGPRVEVEGERERLTELVDALLANLGPTLIRLDSVSDRPELAPIAAAAGVAGSLLAVPLEQMDNVLGMLLVSRVRAPFSDADLRLVSTFADQASTAISNARLYEQVQRASEDLERKVKERTEELVQTNEDLGNALGELQQAQFALVHSERMAGLGQLVAGVAHEVNSPAASIQGAVDNLAENVARLAGRARAVGELKMSPEDRTRYFALVEQLAPRLQATRVEAPAQVRRQARELAAHLEKLGVPSAEDACRVLVEIGAAEAAYQIVQLAQTARVTSNEPGAVIESSLDVLVGYLEQYAYLFRNTYAIRMAIRNITRIVGALKGYSHLDQAKIESVDIHEGIENTLVILHSELKYGITVTRKFAPLPLVPVYVDELNQVWTNLIVNAAQALGGQGEIVIETALQPPNIVVSIEDNGSGIPREILPKIFDVFFTTKPKGEGTGLGLGIVKQIVDKHGGQIEVASEAGHTRFSVYLPLSGPTRPAPPLGLPS